MKDQRTYSASHVHRTALRLVRCLGHKAASDYCLANQWVGIYEEIQSLEGAAPAEHR